MYNPDDVAPLGSYALCMAHAERGLIHAALEQYDGDFEAAADSLRVSERFLWLRANELGLITPTAPVPSAPPVLQAVPMPEPTPLVAEEPTKPRPMAISRPRVATPIASPIAAAAPVRKADTTPELTLEEREALAKSLLDDEEDDEDDED